MSIFYEEGMRNSIIGLLNSTVAKEILKILSPTMNYEVGHVSSVPVLKNPKEDIDQVDECIKISKEDWDSSEISWHFKRSPLV